jgi:hypothetical protein
MSSVVFKKIIRSVCKTKNIPINKNIPKKQNMRPELPMKEAWE